MSKVYISLTADTEGLQQAFCNALKPHEIKVNTNTRTTPVDGGPSKMQEANEWGADLYVAVRHKASCSMSVRPNDEQSKVLSEKVSGRLKRILGGSVSVNEADYIAEINHVQARAVLYILIDMEGAEPEEIAAAICEPCIEWLPCDSEDEKQEHESKEEPPVKEEVSNTADVFDRIGYHIASALRLFWEVRNG